ncbi:MAG: SHOCT domain-containing protein [Clostridia bacterium]|nr:SHOCT domain-containing protein [Clostridia bacterium]
MAEEVKEEKIKPGKVSKLLMQTAILGLFAVAGVIVLLITGSLGKAADNRGLILALAIFGFICLGSLLALPWVRYLERGKYKIVSWVFAAFVIVCVLLWIIASFVVNGLINKIINETITDTYAFNTIIFVRIVLIITLQFVAANFIAGNVLRYGKKMIVFQGIAYFSYAYIDMWLSCLLSIIVLVNKGGGDYELSYSPGLKDFVFTRWVWTLALVALVWVIVSNTIISNTNKNGDLRRTGYDYDRYGRRRRRSLSGRLLGAMVDKLERQGEDEEIDAENEEAKKPAPEANDAKAKLAKLKEMYDQGLLTKEEYDEKRQKIVDEL